MATVTRSRGQLVLICALALALGFVAIVLVLNSAIYTNNLSARYDDPTADAVSFSRDARFAAGGYLDHANERHAADGWDTIRAEYLDGVADIETGVQSDHAVDGRLVRIEHVPGSATRGVRITDDEPAGSTFLPVTNASTHADWTVAPGVRARQYEMRVATASLETLTSSDAETLLDSPLDVDTGFVVSFDDGATEWLVALYTDGTGTLSVMVHEAGTTVYRTCTASTARAHIAFTTGEIDGRSCQPLTFVSNLSGRYTVRYYNGGLVAGTYELVADRAIDAETGEAGAFTDAVDDANYGEHCAGPTYASAVDTTYPKVTPAIYATALETRFDEPRVAYRATQRVAPGEHSPARTPRVLSWNVAEADSDAADGRYQVSWNVMDPDGPDADVDITVEVTEPDGETKTFTALGTGDGSATLDADDESGNFTIRLVVDDGPDDDAVDGNARTSVQRHEDDGDDAGCPP